MSRPGIRIVAGSLVLLLAAVVVTVRWDQPGGGTAVLPSRVQPRPEPLLGKELPVNARRGVVMQGLQRTFSGRCAGAWVAPQSGRCTHGPDPAPDGTDVTASRPPVRTTAGGGSGEGGPEPMTVPGTAGIACDGDGVSGKRVQAIYARASDRPDRYSTYLSSIRTWAAGADAAFDQSAAKTGGSRRVRWVTDAACNLTVLDVVLPPSGDDNLDKTIGELEKLGHDRSDRMYLVWMDANVYCGIATLWVDDRPGQENWNNSGASYGRIDSGCWGFWPSVEAHELMHTFGAVQPSAPHGTGGHCTDRYDRMCYDDGSGFPMQFLCPDPSFEAFFDCNDDDYFHTRPPAGSYLDTRWNVARSAFLIPGPAPVAGRYAPLTPARIFDTRSGTGGRSTKLVGGSRVDVQVAGRGGVPSTGVSAVVLNATVTNPSQPSHLTVYPAGASRPDASNLNFTGGLTVANLVVARLGDAGKASLMLDAGSADVVLDVAGWFSESSDGTDGRYRPLDPARILDTRSGGLIGRLAPGQTIEVQVAGRGGVPSSGVSAVALNATVTAGTASGYLTLYPAGSPLPATSTLNFLSGQTVPNRVLAKVGSGGRVSVYNPSGFTHVVLDVAGWFTDSTSAEGTDGATTALAPSRILDSRTGLGGINGALQGGRPYDVQVAGRAGVPSTGATGVVLNVTVTAPTQPGYLTVYPSGAQVPLASDLNFVSGQTVPNLVVAKLGSGGKVAVYLSAGSAHVIYDVVGYVA